MINLFQEKAGKFIAGQVRYKVPLRMYTTWRIGGPAQIFVIPKNKDDVLRVIEFVNEYRIPLFVLGRGSNILIDDAGLPGITLYMAKSFQHIEVIGNTIQVGGGVALPKLSKISIEHGCKGFEFLAGIPGTVGAGVLINAGAGGYEMGDVLESVTLLDKNGDVKTLKASELQLAYRNSALLSEPVVVIKADFRFEPAPDLERVKQMRRDFLVKRRQKFPLSFPNAGSVFKRPEGGSGPPAGWLLEKAGMKGHRIGDAQVSELHANFIINLGQASSQDVKSLVNVMHMRVLEFHNIDLERENIFFPEECRW